MSQAFTFLLIRQGRQAGYAVEAAGPVEALSRLIIYLGRRPEQLTILRRGDRLTLERPDGELLADVTALGERRAYHALGFLQGLAAAEGPAITPPARPALTLLQGGRA